MDEGGGHQDRAIWKEEQARFNRAEVGACGQALCGQLSVWIYGRRKVRARDKDCGVLSVESLTWMNSSRRRGSLQREEELEQHQHLEDAKGKRARPPSIPPPTLRFSSKPHSVGIPSWSFINTTTPLWEWAISSCP